VGSIKPKAKECKFVVMLLCLWFVGVEVIVFGFLIA